jgi:nucleotide-binding universal stress UspA family protein
LNCRILMAFNDSSSSSTALDYLTKVFSCPEECMVTLLHVFRKPTGSEEMMGKKFMRGAPERIRESMQAARQKLADAGFRPENITLRIVETTYPTEAEAIIEQFRKDTYNLVVIGRKRMSKTEEFVVGDTSIRLVRALEGTAVLVVKE